MASVSLRIGPADQGRGMSLDEFHEAEAQDGYLYELARGVLEVTNVPSVPHWQIVDNLHEGFSAYRREQPGLIQLIGHGSDVRYVIPELESDRHPDLAIVFRGAPRDAHGNRQALLAVEVVSPGSRSRKRDLETKREEYLAVGVLEYWIVDPKIRQVTLLVRREDGAEGAAWDEQIIPSEGVIVSGLLPGFAFRVAGLWVDADLNNDDPVDP